MRAAASSIIASGAGAATTVRGATGVAATGAAGLAGTGVTGEDEDAGLVAAASVEAATATVSRVMTSTPSETLSPILTFNSLTTPDIGAGTSIVALSDSSVINGSSAVTLSPGATRISITGMFL